MIYPCSVHACFPLFFCKHPQFLCAVPWKLSGGLSCCKYRRRLHRCLEIQQNATNGVTSDVRGIICKLGYLMITAVKFTGSGQIFINLLFISASLRRIWSLSATGTSRHFCHTTAHKKGEMMDGWIPQQTLLYLPVWKLSRETAAGMVFSFFSSSSFVISRAPLVAQTPGR